MIFIILCIFVHRMKITAVSEGLIPRLMFFYPWRKRRCLVHCLACAILVHVDTFNALMVVSYCSRSAMVFYVKTMAKRRKTHENASLARIVSYVSH